MSVHVALLRAINVGGRNQIAMSKLRDLLENLGFTGVQSLLQSGNLVFHSDRRAVAALERLLEVETTKQLEVSVDYVIRTADEWHQVVAHNPYPEEAKQDPGHLVVMFLKSAPPAKAMQALQAASKGSEVVQCWGKHLYVVYPDGIGRSKFTGTLIEQKLGSRGTGRNWNTVLKLAALVQE